MHDAAANGAADLFIVSLGPNCNQCVDCISETQERCGAPVLVVVSLDDVRLYAEAMQRGAYDGLGLPLNETEVVRIVGRALEGRRQDHVVGSRQRKLRREFFLTLSNFPQAITCDSAENKAITHGNDIADSRLMDGSLAPAVLWLLHNGERSTEKAMFEQ